MRILLIDADILAYQHAASTQRAYRFPDDPEQPAVAIDDPEEACMAADSKVSQWLDQLDAQHAVICLSCPSSENFRKDIWPAYKANRNPAARPFHLETLKRHLEENYVSYRRPRLEADDIMGILSTMRQLPPSLAEKLELKRPLGPSDQRIVVSEDKDLQTVPGWLWNPPKDRKPRLITEAEADRWHLYQALVGDATDNYPGCPRIGAVRAQQALGKSPSWGSVVACYEARGLTSDDALVQARVARILRASDYDFINKEPILWQPPSAT